MLLTPATDSPVSLCSCGFQEQQPHHRSPWITLTVISLFLPTETTFLRKRNGRYVCLLAVSLGLCSSLWLHTRLLFLSTWIPSRLTCTSSQSRYVFVGRRTTINKQKDRQSGNGVWPSSSGPRPLAKAYTDEYCISVFKSKVSADTLAAAILGNLYSNL